MQRAAIVAVLAIAAPVAAEPPELTDAVADQLVGRWSDNSALVLWPANTEHALPDSHLELIVERAGASLHAELFEVDRAGHRRSDVEYVIERRAVRVRCAHGCPWQLDRWFELPIDDASVTPLGSGHTETTVKFLARQAAGPASVDSPSSTRS